MNVLLLGELVGRCGTGVVKNALRQFRKDNDIDVVIAGGECVTGGFGLGYANALLLLGMGIDVLTMGEKSFYKLDMVESIGKKDRILRPANFPETAPGRGIMHFRTPKGIVCIINMLGMMGFNNPHLNNPFPFSQGLCDKARQETPFVIYIFHSQATAEKKSMGFLLDGRASVVAGIHTKALTGDASILPGGTAYITDLGRVGSLMSVGGFDPENEIKKYRTGIPVRSRESFAKPRMQGMMVKLDDNTGMALEVKTINFDIGVI